MLSAVLSEFLPANARVLDIGCGDGVVGQLLMERDPTRTVTGIETSPRPQCRIEYKIYDGKRIPFDDASFDVCMLVDVLHHSRSVLSLMQEARRVTRKFILIKDHACESRLDFQLLRLMDWVGNRPYGVESAANYLSRRQWQECFESCALRTVKWQDTVFVHPFLFRMILSPRLHFVGLLSKDSDASGET